MKKPKGKAQIFKSFSDGFRCFEFEGEREREREGERERERQKAS